MDVVSIDRAYIQERFDSMPQSYLMGISFCGWNEGGAIGWIKLRIVDLGADPYSEETLLQRIWDRVSQILNSQRSRIMAIISTFELLVKPQLPKNIPGGNTPIPGQVSKLSRNVILGYFLTLANLSNLDFSCKLIFTIRLPEGRKMKDLLGVIDTSGSDDFLDLQMIAPNQFEAPMILPPQSTSLIILQPNFIAFSDLLNSLDFEVRGFVEIRRTAAAQELPPITIIATPEHRGTFFSSLSGSTPDEIGLDQVAYALPIKNGGFLEV